MYDVSTAGVLAAGLISKDASSSLSGPAFIHSLRKPTVYRVE
jgi:hypothetical protein